MPRSHPRDRPSAVDVRLHLNGRVWEFCRGDTVTVGRSRASVVRLPDDDHLSRRAMTLTVLDDCLLIRNESHSKPLVLRPPAGEDRIVEPGTGTTSLPYPRFDLVLAGSDGLVVSIRVDAARLTADAYVDDPSTRTPETRSEPIVLSGAQRRVLLALCAPLLTESGPRAAPATYTQIGQRIGRQPGYVRNVIKTLRESLAGYGVTGLIQEGPDAGPGDFRWELARWAIRSGSVTAADLDGGDDRR